MLRLTFAFLISFSTAFAAPEHDHTHDQQFILASKNELYAQEIIGKVGAEEVFRRTEFILNYFDSPAEQNYQGYLNTLNVNTPTGIIDYLKSVLDPTGQFDRIFSERNSKVESFRDRDAKRISEYNVNLVDRQHYRHSLRGLRVAIDPGHMGGNLWDKRTGKYVTDGSQKVSEGLIALQTSLLLEEQLVAMGAKVLLTRRNLKPVTNAKYEDLDVNYFARRELRARSMEPWFLDLIQQNATERELIAAFNRSPNLKKLFAERSRLEYFAQREDLYARNLMLAEFKPHITLLVHYDASINSPNSAARNKTFAYVPGGYFATEFGSSESRANFLAHLAQGAQWQDSVELSSMIVGTIGKNLNVALSTSDSSGVKVAPGVFARNLALTRLITYSPVVFLECLHYGESREFERLLVHDGGETAIEGIRYGYSQRIAEVAESIANAMSDFYN